MKKIVIKKAGEHNLKSVDLEIPRDSLVVVTGVSGSGKSSLAFDTIYREGERRYLSSLSSYARQFLGKFGRPAFEKIDGLSPTLSVNQKTVVRNPRSTVGTMSEISDYLRLLFARLGNCKKGTNSSFFSFNSEKGACKTCKGLGVEDRILPELIISDKHKSIRDGALILTTPNGYIVYSQVTLEVLNQVCRAHGFDIDIPWEELTPEQRGVVLYGSEKIKIPYGKHPLKSRLKWSGITAKPREEGYYKGIIPVMDVILKRSRNKNILRFARSVKCGSCGGLRLNEEALRVTCFGENIAAMSAMPLDALYSFFKKQELSEQKRPVGEPIIEQVLERIKLLRELGLGYLSCDRRSTTLSAGEAQRIRLATQAGNKLQGVLYVLDEPSIGLHPRDNKRLLETLKKLRDNGNSVIVVEHDEETMRNADWIVDIGPGAGKLGGKILCSAAAEDLIKKPPGESETLAYLLGKKEITPPAKHREGNGEIKIFGACRFNLKDIDVRVKTGAFNVITGVSGAGKSTLISMLADSLKRSNSPAHDNPREYSKIEGLEQINKVIEIDQAPIGRTPRSNPATYTKLFDQIRGLFSKQKISKERGWDKGRFSFNVSGGRCEACKGAGVRQIGMHFLEDVSVMCEECSGKRFNESTLEVLYRSKNIHDVLEMPIQEASEFFKDNLKITSHLNTLMEVGLGYIALGQPSTTLSGGEAQRVKLAAHLAKPATGKTLYILNEPTIGLHNADIVILLKALNKLVDAGNTVLAIEQNLDFIKTADWMVDLGPESGESGGRVVFMGTPEEAARTGTSLTCKALKEHAGQSKWPGKARGEKKIPARRNQIELRGVSTHNLKSIDADIPHGKLTVITGLSGSGKSSFAYNTVYAEGRRKFSESLSTHARRYLNKLPKPPVERISGINPVIAIGQNRSKDNPRSTVATLTGIMDFYRLIYSRAGIINGKKTNFSAGMFSFNHHQGACVKCRGLGVNTVCSPEAIVSHPRLSLLDGAMDGSKTGRFYGERDGQYLAILREVGRKKGLDFSLPYCELSPEAREIAMRGTGDIKWNVTWRFDRKGRRGKHIWETVWLGFCGYVEEEYQRVHADQRGEKMISLMNEIPCSECLGKRLNPEVLKVKFAGLDIAGLCAMSITETLDFLNDLEDNPSKYKVAGNDILITGEVRREISERLKVILEVGLGYLCLDRRTSTLSGGELQRILLATQLGNKLCGVTYVLDEPTVGLHDRDTAKLIGVLKHLRDEGNTVLVVEHDEKVIRSADYIIDMGPGAGSLGGEIVADGNTTDIEQTEESLTGQYLSGKMIIHNPGGGGCPRDGIKIIGAFANNLKGINVEIPKGCIVAVTGVSGSGKSSLVFDALAASFNRKRPVNCVEITGLDEYEKIAGIDHTPIGRSPLSNPATYCGIFDRIRELFAKTEQARSINLNKSYFSFNSKGGRCETCRGMGYQKVEMGFLSDVWVPCEECGGARYGKEALKILFRGKSILQVLESTVDEATELFRNDSKLAFPLDLLCSVGLGYLRLGQPSNTLSGGESQRLKLAAELIKSGNKKNEKDGRNNLYIFDEPTTGLHFQDVERLVGIFSGLTRNGHTVLVVEHNLDVIENADWIIDLGPEGGDGGGEMVVCGKVEKIAACGQSWTGRALKERRVRLNKQSGN